MGDWAYPEAPRAGVKAGVWDMPQARGVVGQVPLAGQVEGECD